MASHIIGKVDIDGKGISGVELKLNKKLKLSNMNTLTFWTCVTIWTDQQFTYCRQICSKVHFLKKILFCIFVGQVFIRGSGIRKSKKEGNDVGVYIQSSWDEGCDDSSESWPKTPSDWTLAKNSEASSSSGLALCTAKNKIIFK